METNSCRLASFAVVCSFGQGFGGNRLPWKQSGAFRFKASAPTCLSSLSRCDSHNKVGDNELHRFIYIYVSFFYFQENVHIFSSRSVLSRWFHIYRICAKSVRDVSPTISRFLIFSSLTDISRNKKKKKRKRRSF